MSVEAVLLSARKLCAGFSVQSSFGIGHCLVIAELYRWLDAFGYGCPPDSALGFSPSGLGVGPPLANAGRRNRLIEHAAARSIVAFRRLLFCSEPAYSAGSGLPVGSRLCVAKRTETAA